MLGKIEGRRRRGWQRMRWLDVITDSMDMGLGGLLGVGDGQGGLGFCGSWGCKESDMTEQLNWTEYSIVHMYYIFIYSFVSGHLGCFHLLAIVNNAAMNIRVDVSLWIMVFMGYMSNRGITGSYGSFGYFPHSSAGKESTCNAGDPGSIPWVMWDSLIVQLPKNQPAMQKTPVWFLGQEDLLEKV